MGNRTTRPAWGVLARLTLDEIAKIFHDLPKSIKNEHVEFRTNGDWTAAFYLELSDPADDSAAELLCRRGIFPVYAFDFNRHESLSFVWDGVDWRQDEEPKKILADVGIEMPGSQGTIPDPMAGTAAIARRATIIEMFARQHLRAFLPLSGASVAEGRMGAIAYDVDIDIRARIWNETAQRIFEVLFYPEIGDFVLKIIKDQKCLGTFNPGETRTWDGTPFLADFEGATTAVGVLDKLGIPRSFLDPLPPKATDPGADDK
jgi:hypothetical protein